MVAVTILRVVESDAWESCVRWLEAKPRLLCRGSCSELRRATDDAVRLRHSMRHPHVPPWLAIYAVDDLAMMHASAVLRDRTARLQACAAAVAAVMEVSALGNLGMQVVAVRVAHRILRGLASRDAPENLPSAVPALQPPPWLAGWVFEEGSEDEAQDG